MTKIQLTPLTTAELVERSNRNRCQRIARRVMLDTAMHIDNDRADVARAYRAADAVDEPLN